MYDWQCPCKRQWMQHVMTSQQSHAKDGFTPRGDTLLAILLVITFAVMVMKICGQTRDILKLRNDFQYCVYSDACTIMQVEKSDKDKSGSLNRFKKYCVLYVVCYDSVPTWTAILFLIVHSSVFLM